LGVDAALRPHALAGGNPLGHRFHARDRPAAVPASRPARIAIFGQIGDTFSAHEIRTLARFSKQEDSARVAVARVLCHAGLGAGEPQRSPESRPARDRKSTRLNSSHVAISYAVFCLKKKNSKINKSSKHVT